MSPGEHEIVLMEGERGHRSERSVDVAEQQSREPSEEMGLSGPGGHGMEPEEEASAYSGRQLLGARRATVL